MDELLCQNLDPRNIERNYSHITFLQLSPAHSVCCTASQYHSFPILILSVSPCILLSVMSVLRVQRSGRVADYFLIYLQAAERIERLKSAQCSHAWMCVHSMCKPLFERRASASGSHLCLCLCAGVRASPAHAWDMQLSGSATGGECWSVSLFDPRFPLPHNNMDRFSYIVFLFPSSTLLSNPALPLVSPFLGTWLSESV